MISLWSFQMLMGADRARLAMAKMMGVRSIGAMKIISFINARPCELVAVKVLAPAAEEPIQELIAECSDSTGM
jgi:hypothetical protein